MSGTSLQALLGSYLCPGVASGTAWGHPRLPVACLAYPDSQPCNLSPCIPNSCPLSLLPAKSVAGSSCRDLLPKPSPTATFNHPPILCPPGTFSGSAPPPSPMTSPLPNTHIYPSSDLTALGPASAFHVSLGGPKMPSLPPCHPVDPQGQNLFLTHHSRLSPKEHPHSRIPWVVSGTLGTGVSSAQCWAGAFADVSV